MTDSTTQHRSSAPTAGGQPKVFFRGLNGIRAVAALGVMFSHTIGKLRAFGFEERSGLELAGSSVTIFFTLSGFLITYLLMIEKERFSRIHLREFYLRRILRIWPLYFSYILIALFMQSVVFGGEVSNKGFLIFYVLFLANIPFNLNRPPEHLGHLWSIGIEEQFYSFWPVVVSKVRRLSKFLLILIGALVAIRAVAMAYHVTGHSRVPYSLSMSMRFDCMATGALFAIAYHQRKEWLLRWARSSIVPIVFWVFIVLSLINRFPNLSLIHPNVISLIAAFYILHEIQSERRWTIVENPVMSFLGTISFGIYVYQPLMVAVIAFVAAHLGIGMQSEIVMAIAVIAATIGVAYASYHLLEQPFLRLKDRFSLVKSGKHA